MVQINYLAIFLCTVLSMVLGSIWYGPLFGNQWMKMMGIKKGGLGGISGSEMAKLYGIQTIGSIVMALVLSQFSGFSIFLIWAGFVAPVTLGTVLWEGKPWKLWILNNSYYLILLYMMRVILSFWA